MNVLGDSFGAGVVAHLSKKELEEFDKHFGDLDVELDDMGNPKANGGQEIADGASNDMYPQLK